MIDESLRKEHFEIIQDDKARKMYDYLCMECEKRPGGMIGADQLLVYDVAYMEQVKTMLRESIAQKGIGKEVRNGRQTYFAENKSLQQFRSYCDQQRKLLSELKLTPTGRKAAESSADDEFDAFD